MNKQEMAMSNEKDLDWLAQNVHHWGSDHARTISYSTEFGGERYGDGLPYPKYTKAQWLARRAELQNKPSWVAVPSLANWLAQDAAGSWLWHSSEPECRNGGWIGSTTRGYAAKGCVLGDWRDTLEKRPEHARAEMEVELVKAAFQPFTSIEDNQEQEMKHDNGWFERGELPPVGCLCLYVVSDRLSAEVEITAHAKLGLCFVLVGHSGESYVSKTAELYRFRPIRTERELAIEEMRQACPYHGCWEQVGRIYAEALYDAGYRKEAK